MVDHVRTRACANIALTKYWGKAGDGNVPATPSVSLALDALATETTVERVGGVRDRFALDGRLVDAATRKRLVTYLDLWRSRGLLVGRVSVTSWNRFPTAAGLASSASGFAALATALAALSGRRVGSDTLSRLARFGSGSAARSIPGGIASLAAGGDPAARLVVPADDVPWCMVVALAGEGAKKVGSRSGMVVTAETSPLYDAWVAQAKRDHRAVLAAIRTFDLDRAGAVAEANMLAMHATAMAARPGLLYWSPATVRLLRSVRTWREKDLSVWATIDAGPHVALLCRAEDQRRVALRARRVEGVTGVLVGMPAGPAEVLEAR